MISNSNVFITDIFGENNYGQNPSFAVTKFDGTFTKSNLLNIVNDKTDSVALLDFLAVSETSPSFANPGNYCSYFDLLIW